ncbi:NHS-like protein 2 isoform X2 [Spea bombifrons]|uniref:NHS-like protein 2 isoform X2 n=1 Tax=Spea bombifrons TaxID=233779 RepID=UPI00234A2CE6|nr:NHS-like protein 2 isoform X2 [Spea bombifrons]
MMGNSPHKQRSKKHHRMQPATAAAPVDHSKLANWQQQPVNVFLSSKRPPCVEELHQEAELNLSILQGDSFSEEFEDRYLDTKVTGQTFRYSALSQSTTIPPETPTRHTPKRLEFVYLPANRRVSEDETTTVGVRPRETCLSLPTTPDKQVAWIKAFPFPIPEERRWHQSNSIQTNIVPINVSGEVFDKHATSRHSLFNTETAVNPKTTLRRRRTIIGFSHQPQQDHGESKACSTESNTKQGASAAVPAKTGNANGVTCSEQPPVTEEQPSKPESSHGRHPGGRAATPHPQQLPLRKTFSDLGHILQNPSDGDSTGVMYANASCNGAKDSGSLTQGCSFNYMTPSSPVKSQPSETMKCSTLSMASPGISKGGGSYKLRKENVTRSNGNTVCTTLPSPSVNHAKDVESKGNFHPVQPGISNSSTMPILSGECTFRERSLSMPTDSGSLSSVDIAYTENRRGSGDYALNYPSGSSEESTSTENVSVVAEQDNQERRRSRSISLRKPKKKPSPPARSVSLIKDGSTQKLQPASTMPKDQRPKSLCIAFDSQGHSYIQSAIQGTATMPTAKSMFFSQSWDHSNYKSNDLYKTLSASTMATGNTVIEYTKTQGSSESLTSNSRATTPSQVSTGPDSKISSPGKPLALMSPSSGYSSQSETPTAVPTSLILGHSPYQSNRVRPIVPERKSSLPAVSPIDRSPKVRQPFDVPLTPPTHLDLTCVRKSSKGKVKTSRNHSESTFGTKLNQKTSPVQPIMPMVTQSDLRSIRLRSVSKSEPEDNLDGIDPIDELVDEAFPLPDKKVKPPVAEKPPMSRRPINLAYRSSAVTPESPVMSPNSPGEYVRDQSSPQDAYMVIGTIRHKKSYEAETRVETPPSIEPSPPSEGYLYAVPLGDRSFSQSSAEEEELIKGKHIPERITIQSLAYADKKKVKVPPPIPKKPSVLHLPVPSPPPTSQATCTNSEQRLSPSLVITLDAGAKSYPDIIEFKKYDAGGTISAAQPDLVSVESLAGTLADTSENRCVSRKTAESIIEDDDEVFVSSRTTEDLFTVIHRSKRKLLGWKDSGDSFGSRQSSVSPIKNSSGSTNSDFSTGTLSTIGTSSKNEDFKALLQRKGSKSSLGSRPSAAELLKTTNPLARRVMNEFAPEIEKNSNSKTLP